MTSLQKDKILARACELYLTDGLEGFSMRKLAKSVGVTAPALYRHYESKESLLVAVVGEAYRMFAQYIYRALAGPTPDARLYRAGHEYLQFALENPEMYEMLYIAPRHIGLEEYPLEIAEVAAATGQFWQDRIRECIQAGIFREGDPDELSLTMWAHAHGLITIYLRGMCPLMEEDFHTMYRSSTARLMEGLAGPNWVPPSERPPCEGGVAEDTPGKAETLVAATTTSS